MKLIKSLVCFALVATMIFGAAVVTNTGIKTSAFNESDTNTISGFSVWSGEAATAFAKGSGLQDDPYIIETADQLYLALTQITDTVNNVAGGIQTSEMLKQSSTTEYVPVYTPYYYKVADGVNAIYLNDIVGNETLDSIKSFVAGSSKKDWRPGKSFVGNLDGNGVTVYGMYASGGHGFVYKLDGSATIKNFNFDSCYSKSSGNAAIVTTILGSYTNDSTIQTIANISVTNCYIATTRKITLSDSNGDGYYEHAQGASGIVSTGSTTENLTIANCIFDGYSCEVIQGAGSAGTVPDGYVSTYGGIISGGYSMNNVTLLGCVSLGAPAVDEVYVSGQEVFYNRYDKNKGFQVSFYNTYSDFPATLCDIYPGLYDKLLDITRVSTQSVYSMCDMPKLNWRSDWQFGAVAGGADKFDNTTQRLIPMPKYNSSVISDMFTYSLQIAGQNNAGGAYSVFGGPYYNGTYGMYHDLFGSGTEQDPYLIYNAFELARAIASGGMNAYNRVYYKLACDIDASDVTWITQDTISATNTDKYKYVDFNGVLDGDGHTISGVYAGDDQTIGLIPVLAKNGVVKNLHLRNSTFVSGEGYAGAIVGETKVGAQVIGCSVENCVVVSSQTDNHIVGRIRGVVIKNSYYIADDTSSVTQKTTYYNANGALGNINVAQNNDTWYIGGKDGSTPRLKNFAVAQTLTDVDGDGIATEYTARDLAALRNLLLLEDGYQYLYADVDRNGKTNILDLVVLCNEMIGDFSNPNNEFWRNVKLGMVNIYYGENDSYDAARKLELYLEAAVPDLDIKKVVSADKTVSGTSSDASAVYVHSNDLVGKPTGELEIIVGDIANYSDYAKNTLDVNDYAIAYDAEKGVLWFKGGSFTGVEQAILDFISNSKVETGDIYTVERATLSEEKQAKTVLVDTDYDGEADTEKVLYYAWGDEFDGITNSDEDENSQISIDTWNHSRMRTETESGKAGNYNNVETANETELSKLYSIENGRLTITRGIKTEYATDDTDKLGYVRLENQTGYTALKDQIDDEDIIANPGLIKTNSSMLYKQGYAEMYGSLPSDGHTFASWWMLGHGSYNNYAIDETLFSKIYKLNNTGECAYDGTSTWPLSTDPKTYKYQIPTNYFEIDVWELMQNPSLTNSTLRKTKTTGSYDYRLYLNVHKFYSVGARSADVVNVIDWDNPSTPRAVMNKEYFGSKSYYFSTSAAYYDFTDGTTTRLTKDWLGRITANYAEALQKQLTAPRRYGFYWSTNGVDKFNFTLYIYDINGDGIEDDNAILGTSDMTYNKDSGMDPQDYDCVNDAEVANQYMYFLLDNVLYTSNPGHQNSTTEEAVMHTDMLIDNGTEDNPDKIDLEIDYLRVYQFDGKRDIIVRETEDFNNGNHFGY